MRKMTFERETNGGYNDYNFLCGGNAMIIDAVYLIKYTHIFAVIRPFCFIYVHFLGIIRGIRCIFLDNNTK